MQWHLYCNYTYYIWWVYNTYTLYYSGFNVNNTFPQILFQRILYGHFFKHTLIHSFSGWFFFPYVKNNLGSEPFSSVGQVIKNQQICCCWPKCSRCFTATPSHCYSWCGLHCGDTVQTLLYNLFIVPIISIWRSKSISMLIS